MTDAFLVQGLLDPNSYFWRRNEDRYRASTCRYRRSDRQAVGLTEIAAAEAMEKSWVAKVRTA